MEVEWVQGVEHEKELIQREFNQMELGKFVQLLLKVQRTLLTNSSILLEEDSPMAKQNQQVQPERIMVWETIIILLDFGSKQLDKEGSPDSGLPFLYHGIIPVSIFPRIETEAVFPKANLTVQVP